jgi:arylsulfatase A-like enzyme/4-amino-4-deoxy-L-arabinose transferase-like glycosyltransferase
MRARSGLALFGVALALRLGFVAWAPRVPGADGVSYHGYAQSLMLGMGYVNPDGSPGITWMPGWPLLLAGLYRLFGFDPAVGMVASALLGAAGAPLLAALGSRLLDLRRGLLAGALYAVWPGLICYSATLYCEDLFNALFLATLLLLVRAAQVRRRSLGFAAAGLGFGLCALVKAEPLVVTPVLLGFLWSVRQGAADFARQSALLLGVTAAVLTPWVIRNELHFDRILPVTASGGSLAYIGNHPGATGAFDYFADLYWAEQNRAEDRARTDLARNDAGWEAAARFVRDHPGEALRIAGAKLYFTYAGDGAGATLVRGFGGPAHWHLSESTWRQMVRIADGFWFAALALAAVGLGTVRRWSRQARILVLGPIAAWLAVHLVFVGGPRFHVPEIPGLALLAASGAARLWDALPRRRSAAAAALVALAALSGCAPAGPRNLLLIVVDTLRADHLGCYGYARDTSPNIDALAAEGVRFERAYAPASWTKPSMASLLTGLYPSRHGVTDVRHTLPDDATTLATRLSARGYATAAVVSNVQLTDPEGNGMGRGFRRYVEIHAAGYDYVSTPDVTRQAVAALRQLASGDGPFFLMAHYFDPHANYRRHARVGFAAERAGRLDGTQRIEELQNELLATLSPEEVGFLRDLYDEEIRFTDAGIGRLLAALRELGREQDTLVVFTADHGEEFLDHGWLGHVRSLYEELVRVPLVVRDPGAADVPRSVATPVSLVSLVPTILARLGAPADARLDGPSLARVIEEGGEPAAEAVFAEVAYVPLVLPFSKKRTFKQAVIGERFKLIRDLESERLELFDLSRDPDERSDLAQERSDLTGPLAALLDGFQEGRRDAPAASRELGKAERQLLEELGYLER